MPAAAATSAPASAPASASASALFRRLPAVSGRSLIRPMKIPAGIRQCVSCQVALTADLLSSSSSSLASEEETLAAEKVIGERIRVKVPLKVYHVVKAPDLELLGMEGVIKQYVGVWKGKRISANLPFKVEFFVDVEGQPSPVKFFTHLKEDEFEFISTD